MFAHSTSDVQAVYTLGVGFTHGSYSNLIQIDYPIFARTTITRITAVVDYNPGGGDFQRAIVYVPAYGATSRRLKIGDTATDLRFTPARTSSWRISLGPALCSGC